MEVRSDHFTVITDAGEKNGRHVADLFEQMRAAFGVVFVRTKINQPIPLLIIAFRNTKELRQYSPIYKGKTVELAGFFQPGDDKNFIMVDMSQEDNWQIVFHEYAHLLLNGNFPQTAPWFDEGFAEYLSTMKIGSNGSIEIGALIPGAELLDQASKFRLLDLFQVQHFSETYYRSGERRDMFYVESWLVAHYLFDTNQLTPTAHYFLYTNGQKMPIPDAVQKAYGVTLPAMEKTIWTNWHTGKLYAKRFNGKIPTSFNATARPAGFARGASATGRLRRAHSGLSGQSGTRVRGDSAAESQSSRGSTGIGLRLSAARATAQGRGPFPRCGEAGFDRSSGLLLFRRADAADATG